MRQLPFVTASAITAALATAALVHPLSAQSARPRPASPSNGAKAAPSKAADGLTGSYAGTATVQLGDSTIVVPVSYVFSGVAPAIGGTAMVPGQGTGTISNVLRDGNRVRFRVTAGEGKLLEHDGTIAANGSIEGFVNLDGAPVARFRISPGALRAPEKPRSTRGNTP